jgi:hypothetical protein
MARLLQRFAELRIGERALRGLDVRFTVEKRITPDPNTLDLTVWNLAPQTRAALQREWQPIALVAGYEGAAGLVFSGAARTVAHAPEGSALRTRILCGDGEDSFLLARSDFSAAPGTPLAQIVERLAKDLGVKAGNALARLARRDWPGATERYLQGYSASGATVRELDRVVRAAGLEWSVQDGNLQLLSPDEATAEPAVLLSPDSGLVGTPEHGTSQKEGGPKVLKARSLLQPAIRPGRLVRVESRKITGAFRVVRVVHSGELAERDWYSDIEAVEQAA